MKDTPLVFLALFTAVANSWPVAFAKEPTHAAAEASVPPADALARLKAGNERYVEGRLQHPHQTPKRRTELAAGQQPFAIVLGCADSRTPPEVLFDQGLGDLFVLRVAGNVLDDHVLGSIEYAVEHLGTRTIVVLGHERCGAVKAARETIASKSAAPAHIDSLVAAIKPAVEATAAGDLDATIDANVRNVVRALRSSAPVLKPKVDAAEIAVVGARYDLDTGRVSLLDEKGER